LPIFIYFKVHLLYTSVIKKRKKKKKKKTEERKEAKEEGTEKENIKPCNQFNLSI
jgi:hypothetical protein